MKEQMKSQCRISGSLWAILTAATSPGVRVKHPLNAVVLRQHMPARTVSRHRPWTLHHQFQLCPLLRDLVKEDSGEGASTSRRSAQVSHHRV